MKGYNSRRAMSNVNGLIHLVAHQHYADDKLIRVLTIKANKYL